MTYITAKEASVKWNISSRRICILCKEGRISGAIKKGNVWMLPKNAVKPEDGRKTEIRKGIISPCIIYNPTYFENNKIEPSEDDRIICELQEKFLRGNLDEAYADIDKALINCKDNRYRCIYYLLQYAIGTDMGIKIGVEKVISLVEKDDTLKFERMLIEIYQGQINYFENNGLSEDIYEELIPLVSMICAKRSMNNIVCGYADTDVSCIELLCHEIDKRDCPLISAYFHLYLAVFYNFVGVGRLFEVHYKKALDILLPRKWYTPLAEYSSTIDLKYIEGIDKEAYCQIVKLSERIISAYIEVGLFDKIEDNKKLKENYNIQVGYKLFQGKSNEVIAEELGISQYKVKKQIDELMCIVGVSSKKELREFVLKNCLV